MAVRFLEVLKASFEGNERTGIGTVIAVDRARWLVRQVEQARQELWLAVTGIRDERWLDVFHTLLLRPTMNISLYLVKLPDTQSAADLSMRKHLQVLLDKGLQLYQITELPEWEIVIDPGDPQSRRAIRGLGEPLHYEWTYPHLETTVQEAPIAEAVQRFASLPARQLSPQDIAPPPDVEVFHLSGRESVTEQELFGEIFRNPIVTMQVNDRYLDDEYRIEQRLGQYVRMAAEGGMLQRVDVYTYPAHRDKPSGEQKQAAEKLQRQFPQVNFHFSRRTEHDRYVRCVHHDGSATKIIIGVGLDFIERDGSVRPTYIVIQKERPDDRS